jgi:AbrB family looped-hinge helix DNA binding protein
MEAFAMTLVLERPTPERKRTVAKVTVDQQGRVLIPAEVRQALALKPGDALTLDIEGNDLRLRTTAQALRAAQEYLRRFVPADVSLADELVADRRAEAAREEQG